MMIVAESAGAVKVDLETDSEEQEISRSTCRSDQSWNLNCAPGQTSPEPWTMKMSPALAPKRKMCQLDGDKTATTTTVDKDEDDDEEDDEDDEDGEKLSSDSSSRLELELLRFYYWDAIRWVEFPSKANAVLGAALQRNCESVVLPAGENRLYKIDFRTKSQMNLKTGYVRSVAWEGSCRGSREVAGFENPFERQELLPSDDCLRMMMAGTVWKQDSTKSSAAPHSSERMLMEAPAPSMLPYPFQSKAVETFAKLGDKVAVLEPGHKEFSAVHDVFSKGFRCRPPHGKRPRLTAVHKVLNTEAKLRYFGEQMQSMERSRGNANLRHAWHGSSADAIVSIVMYGFGQRPMSLNGNNFGCGTYLAPFSKLDVSAQYAEQDENKEQHVLLCEVVLGESETVSPGSCHRFLPSSTSYDSGVDDPDNPNLYIVWTPFINSHIIPWYIVSFVTEEARHKLSGPVRRSPDIIRPSPYPCARKPPILEPKHVNELFNPSGLRTFSKSGQLELLARATAALPAMVSCRGRGANENADHGSDNCLLKALNASKQKLHEAARSIQAKKAQNVAGLAPKDDKSRSGRINLNLGLNIDGFSYQSRHPNWLAQSQRHQ
ncbi:hypothetical protein MPTK1_5g18990 [Marchantia polymorpha subsp. ruderalis]|uniref:Poly [ADP-ribose] polymerase n=2 Tax=Marchantia polymorpha TaxID=3197 RepID=A0AAF6BJX3_MARPO|nr:hypothetical protein MARPO_0073s0044 [Marchantia polymorpha]BBN12307.1 hypothetical protein Mp_5g18990 [Marchantia polymorpha subsp. ruderalis]|eukprot:PTQ35170.1 hypothetical protein MARPO_0073s0044 [Marchantia polymorpha]